MMSAAPMLALLKMPASDFPESPSAFTTHDREKLVEVATTLGFVNTTLVEIKTSMREGAQESRSDHKELEGRVRALENFRWWIVGAAAASGFAGQFVIKLLSTPAAPAVIQKIVSP